MNVVKLLWPVFLAMQLLGCVGLPSHSLTDNAHDTDSSYANSLTRALSGEALLGAHWREEQLPEHDLFLLTPEMQAFAERAVGSKKRAFARAEALQRALLLPRAQGGYGLVYSAYITETPAEAFAQLQVNCVSFTLMYVAMARHVGLRAYVNEVDLPPSWDLRNRDAFLFLRHVNAKVVLGRNEEVVIDLEMQRYSPGYKQRFISEDLAAAQFYNNRGMELAAAGDVSGGFLNLRKALLLDDRQSYIWSNLATLYRRQGFMAEAEAAYLYGLKLDASDLTIISNLGGLYRTLGDKEKAEYYFRRAERHRAGNPYYQYSLANSELEGGNLHKALGLVRAAIRQQGDEPRFFQLAAVIYDQLDEPRQAAAMRDKMQRVQLPLIRSN